MPEEERDPALAAPGARTTGADAHGQAAMLLIESILHGLVERSIITVGDAVGLVEAAAEVGEEMRHDLGDAPGSIAGSVTILRTIAASLRIDLGDRPLKVVE